MVYAADGIPRAEALAAQKRLAALLSYKLKREYSEVCGFVRERMLLAMVRSNSLLLCGPLDKGERIRQRPELMDGAKYWGERRDGHKEARSGTRIGLSVVVGV